MADHYPVSVVGGWSHSIWTVRDVAAQPDFWAPGRCILSRSCLLAQIAKAGAVTSEHALRARTMRSGEIMLEDGCHRWAIADELGFGTVPVVMSYEPAAADEAWPAVQMTEESDA